MKSIKTKLILGILFLPVAAFVFLGIGRAITRPGPAQLADKKEKAEDPEKLLIDKWETEYARLKPKLEELPPFKPPEDGIVTRDRLEKYLTVTYGVNVMIDKDAERRPKPENGKFLPIGAALFYARKSVALGQLYEVQLMLREQISPKELSWIGENIKKGLILAYMRLLDNCYGDQKPEEVEKAYLHLIGLVDDYTEKDENQNFIPKPELVDPSEIPEAHYRMALEYHDWIRFSRFNGRDTDFSCLMEKEGIKVADFNPPEVVHPQDVPQTDQ